MLAKPLCVTLDNCLLEVDNFHLQFIKLKANNSSKIK